MKSFKLTTAVIDELDTTHVAMYICDGEQGITLSIALSTVERYLTEAAIQQARLQRARQALLHYMDKLSKTAATGQFVSQTSRKPRADQFLAIHFYLTCWCIIHRHLLLIRKVSQLREVGLTLRPHLRVLKNYTDARDHYEHIDERLPGQKNAHLLAVRNDLGNFNNYTLSFGGERIDIGPESLKLLKKIVGDTLRALKIGTIEKLAKENPERLNGLFMPIRSKRIDREVRQMLRRMPHWTGSGTKNQA